MTDFTDSGVRCDRHVGEVFAPRCGDCDRDRATLKREFDAARVRGSYQPENGEVIRAMYAMVTGVITRAPMQPHVLLASYLPADDLGAAWFRHAVVDALVAAVAADFLAKPNPLGQVQEIMRLLEEQAGEAGG